MPFEVMDQRGGTAGSHFCEDLRSTAERQVGFWKLKSMPDHLETNAMGSAPGSEMVASSPLEKHLLLNGTGSPQSILARDIREKSSVVEGNSIMSKASINSQDNFPKPWSTSSAQHLSYSLGKTTNGFNGSQWESSLFSSSFSDIFNRKLRLSENDVTSQHTAKPVGGLCEEEEPFEASEEIEAKTIGNLLPTEDDLFAEVSNARATGGDDLEDFDLFSSGGGMELEGDDHLIRGLRNNGQAGHSLGLRNADGPVVNGRAYSKHPSFYGGRVTEAALAERNEDFTGKQIKHEQTYAVGAKCSVQQPEMKHIEGLSSESPYSILSSRQIAFSPGAIASSGMDNGSVHVLHSAIQGTIGAPTEPHRISAGRPNLVSPFSAVSASKQLGLLEPGISVGQLKSANQRAPGLHPHSLPEYHDNLANGFPYNSPTLGGMPNHVGSNIIGGINSSHIRGVGSNGHLMDINEGVFGSPGNGSSTQHGNRYLWTKSNLDRQHPSSQMLWPNSPSFVHNVSPHHLSQIPGFTRPPVMLTPTHGHHVGSAPTVNPSMWDRRHAYSGESPDTASLHLGSLGNIGFLGRSASHPLEIGTPNIFPRIAGNLVDMTKHAGVGSPQRMGTNFPGRNPMISVPSSFDSPNDRARSFSHRRVDSNSNSSDRKQYELDVDRIMRGDDTRTTLMIKNIPNKYTSKMLLAAIDEYCRGTYDFIYLPIDFKNKCNVGYAFINMIDAQQIIPFHKAFNGKKWEKFNSEKVANLAYARIQGKSALVAHFQNSSLMNEDKRCRPILFHTDGPNAGDPEPFPVGPNIRPRPGKSRSGINEEIHRHTNVSAVVNVEDSGNGTDSSGSE